LDGGIPLTGAGYLKPADVEAASEVVPAMADWIGKNNREAHCGPLLHFRLNLQAVGLLRQRGLECRATPSRLAVVPDLVALDLEADDSGAFDADTQLTTWSLSWSVARLLTIRNHRVRADP
jgi:hypothetical protein